MEAIHKVLLILACLLFNTGPQHNVLSVQLLKSIVTSHQLLPVKYQGGKVLYYSNALCTFQVQLLLTAGDIQSNPGPTAAENRDHTISNYAPDLSDQHDGRISYNRSQLYQFQHFNQRLENTVWTTITSLGINRKGKTRRGCKGGRRRCKHNNNTHVSDQEGHDVRALNSKFALWNSRSINSKIPMICDLIISNQIDIFALTETWLYGDDRDSVPIADLLNTLPTHTFHHIPRRSRTGGGVGVCIRKTFRVCENKCRSWDSFEYMDLFITAHQTNPLRLVVVYRPQLTKSKQPTFPTFMSDFSTLLELLVSEPNRLMIVGDFNFHVDNESNREALLFLELIDSFSLEQHVRVPTHQQGHTLDLLLTRSSDHSVSDVSTTQILPSDHAAIMCLLAIRKPDPTKVVIKTRKVGEIDIDTFRQDILDSELYTAPSTDLNQLVEQYESVLSNLLDKHAPLITRTITCRPNAPKETVFIECVRVIHSKVSVQLEYYDQYPVDFCS